jgi:hypothetical protein
VAVGVLVNGRGSKAFVTSQKTRTKHRSKALGVFFRTIMAMMGFLLTGCSITKLDGNTVDVGTSVGAIYTNQVLENLILLDGDPDAIPSHFSFEKGSIQTTNTITPGLNIPYGNQVTRTVNTTAPSTVIQAPSDGISLQVMQGWTQSWDIKPVMDPTVMRDLRRVYLTALGKCKLFRDPLWSACKKPEWRNRTLTMLELLEGECTGEDQPCFMSLATSICNRMPVSRSNNAPDRFVMDDMGHKWFCLGNYQTTYNKIVRGRELAISERGYTNHVLPELVLYAIEMTAPPKDPK